MDAWHFLLFIVTGVWRWPCITSRGLQGPLFLIEPPASLTFSNTTGGQANCAARGVPGPHVDWLQENGTPVMPIPGIRQILENGTLYLLPFRPEDYRKDIHNTIYRCRASNMAGTIISRDVLIKAVVAQAFEVQVYRTHVLTGNTAVLTCVIPDFVKEYVSVSSWFRDDAILLPGRSDVGGRYLVTTTAGNLHIREAKPEDGLAHYSCLTLNSLTQERQRSEPAVLSVTDPTGNLPPRLTSRSAMTVTVAKGNDVQLSCSAQGNPLPNYTWFKMTGDMPEVVGTTLRINPAKDIMYIRRVEMEDAGTWICKVANQFGEQRLEIQLVVIEHLDVHVTPQLRIVNSGESATFNCSVAGYPVDSVEWLHNGEMISSGDELDGTITGGGHARLLSAHVLQVVAVSHLDRGMYQCLAKNSKQSAQGSAELRLGDTMPELQYIFIEQALTPGPKVSLRCSATGFPPPQFKWFFYGEPLSELIAGHRLSWPLSIVANFSGCCPRCRIFTLDVRITSEEDSDMRVETSSVKIRQRGQQPEKYALGQYVDQAGDVISHLNISNVQVEDGGLYTCMAINSLGTASHSARINVYGPPSIRNVPPIKVVAHSDIIIHCPYSGYPISTIKWERYGQELPSDLRHKITDIQNGGALQIISVDPNKDKGAYKCIVRSRNGELVQRELELIVRSPPILEPFSFPTSLQEGSRAQVTCSVTSGDMPISFVWYKDNMPLSPSLQIEERSENFFSILIFKDVSSHHSGAYTCVASNSAAKVNYTSQLMVKVAPQWIVEPQDLSTLVGNTVAVHCKARGYPEPQITWLKGEGDIPSDYHTFQSSDGRVQILRNGSIWITSVSSQDEGHYVCTASNGIGSGLSKVIHIGVNEPPRFDVSVKNISAKKNNPVTLVCEVYGDHPIEIIWSLNGNYIHLNSHRISATDIKTMTGLKSQLSIDHTERQDSGLYKCEASNMFGKSELTIHLGIQERPDPPSSLDIVEVSSRFVRLSWRRSFDGNSPLIGYMVQYYSVSSASGNPNYWDKHHSTGSAEIFNLTLPITPDSKVGEEQRELALVGGLHPATVYSMRICAINNIDISEFTEPPVIVKMQEEAPVDSPKNINIKAVEQGTLLISWQIPPKESWNGELKGYIVTWNEHGLPINNTKSLTVKSWGTNKVVLTGLRKFTRYEITVRAYNSVSTGPPSSPLIGTTLEGVPEAPPQHIACSQITSQSIKVSWLPPPATHHGGHLQGYKVLYRPISSFDNVPVVGEVKRTSSCETYLHTLYKFTNYSIRVLAFTDAGDGIVSSPLYCSTEEDLPGPPKSIKAAVLSSQSILVSWLSPLSPNGKITLYNIYSRKAGAIGKHMVYTVRSEDIINKHQLMYEVRGLTEHQHYEFWITAATSTGEGEASAIVSQTTNNRAPANIASFSQSIYTPIQSKVLLPCVAVGNPTPRTRWLYKDQPITFSTFYEVTRDGHLNIHSADSSFVGNYTCSAKNIFGEDEITYTLNVLLAPSSPNLEMKYVTKNSINLQWNLPSDGGTPVQGYILRFKRETDEWQQLELSPDIITHTLNELKCGTQYHIYLTALNRVGNGSPSRILSIRSKGSPPALPKDKDLIQSNATTLQLNLFSWPDGGCPMNSFSVYYKLYSKDDPWKMVTNDIVKERLTIKNLQPATWYQLKISAHNDAGSTNEIFNFATTTTTGSLIPAPIPTSDGTDNISFASTYLNLWILVPIVSGVVILGLIKLWFTISKNSNGVEEEAENNAEDTSDGKIASRDNKRNCEQMYMSDGNKKDNLPNNVSNMRDISPYAMFNVPEVENRFITAMPLDYTVQFKTFGHLENEDSNMVDYPTKLCGNHSWSKHGYYNPRDEKSRMWSTYGSAETATVKSARRYNAKHHDSESDDTSGSLYNDCSGSTAPTYRLPVKCAIDSSTESNEVSPMSERRFTPRHADIRQKMLNRDRDKEHHRTPASNRFEVQKDKQRLEYAIHV